jgi:hypothetical protein
MAVQTPQDKFRNVLCSFSILWNLEMSCDPLVFCGILKCVVSSNCSYSYSEIPGASLVFYVHFW